MRTRIRKDEGTMTSPANEIKIEGYCFDGSDNSENRMDLVKVSYTCEDEPKEIYLTRENLVFLRNVLNEIDIYDVISEKEL